MYYSGQWSHVAGNFFNECGQTYSGFRNIAWLSIQNTNYATQKFYNTVQWSHVAGNFFNECEQTLLWLYQHYIGKFKNYDQIQCYKKFYYSGQWSHVASNFFNECEHAYSGYRNITWLSIQNTNYATKRFYYSGQWSHLAGNFFNECEHSYSGYISITLLSLKIMSKIKQCFKKDLLQWSHLAGNFFNEC